MKRALVVDDETIIAMNLAMALEEAGFEVVTASNGQKALDLFARDGFDIVVTDYMMPRKNGVELALALRDGTCSSDVPIVLVSAAPGAVMQTNPDLFAAFLPKPVREEDILRVVIGLLSPVAGPADA